MPRQGIVHLASPWRIFFVCTEFSFLKTSVESRSAAKSSEDNEGHIPESIRVLGMVTLSDMARLDAESAKGQGWIACTTDAIFLERPQYYDLIIDLTTSTPSKASRPTLHMSKPTPASANGKRKASYKLETVRFTWSDVKLVCTRCQFYCRLAYVLFCFSGRSLIGFLN